MFGIFGIRRRLVGTGFLVQKGFVLWSVLTFGLGLVVECPVGTGTSGIPCGPGNRSGSLGYGCVPPSSISESKSMCLGPSKGTRCVLLLLVGKVS